MLQEVNQNMSAQEEAGQFNNASKGNSIVPGGSFPVEKQVENINDALSSREQTSQSKQSRKRLVKAFKKSERQLKKHTHGKSSTKRLSLSRGTHPRYDPGPHQGSGMPFGCGGVPMMHHPQL